MNAFRQIVRTTTVLAASLVAVAFTCNGPVAPEAGDPFTLQAGQSVRIQGQPLTLRFAAVTQDSRCPRDVQCVWAGDAVAHMQLISTTDTTNAYLHTTPGTDRSTKADLSGYTLELVGLEPYPEAGKRIPPESYLATLRLFARS